MDNIPGCKESKRAQGAFEVYVIQMMLSKTLVSSGYIEFGADSITSKEIPQMNYLEGFSQPLNRIKKFRIHFSKAPLEITAVTVLVHARH